jgi:hypothetical protein
MWEEVYSYIDVQLASNDCCWFGTTCIYVSSLGALHIEMLSRCCMWMVIVDDKCVWWIHTCDIWKLMVDELWHDWICDLTNLCIGEIWWIYLMIIDWMIMMRCELYMYIHKMWWFLWWWWLIACNLKWWIVLVELSMLNE